MSVQPYTSGNFPVYRFYINTASSTTYEVFPLNFNETSLVDELEKDQIFYRRKFDGKLLFGTNDKVLNVLGVEKNRSDDFALLWAFECTDPCALLYLTITKTVSGVPDTYYEGYFSTKLGTFDIDKCTFEVVPLTLDDYNDILDGANIEYNILDPALITERTTRYDLYGSDATDVHYTHNVYIIDAIQYIANQLVPGIAVVSTFLNDVLNPVTLATNRYRYLTIAQKSNIKRPTATNPAGIGMMSFAKLMYFLRCMNLYWSYDGTTLTVEHISHFTQLDGIDLRTQLSTVATNKYKYLTERTYKYEKFSWMEAGYDDFIGSPIYYSGCTNDDSSSNTIEYNFKEITTDLLYIIDCVAVVDSEPLISDDGWVILANEKRGADLYIYFNVSLYSDPPVIIPNMDMSWAYLQTLFWKHDRQKINGYLISNATTFYSAKKTKQQECSIILCNDFDATKKITTELGETYLDHEKGKVSQAIIKPSGEVNLVLLYGDPENADPGYTYSKYVRFYEVNTGATQSTFYLMANSLVAAQVDFVFNVDILDDAGTCNSGNLTVSILAGGIVGLLVYNWCNPGGAGPCINLVTGVSVTPPWLLAENPMNHISDTSRC